MTDVSWDFWLLFDQWCIVAMKCDAFTTTSTREMQLCARPTTQLTCYPLLLADFTCQSIAHVRKSKWKGSIKLQDIFSRWKCCWNSLYFYFTPLIVLWKDKVTAKIQNIIEYLSVLYLRCYWSLCNWTWCVDVLLLISNILTKCKQSGHSVDWQQHCDCILTITL